jgi:hypothetical protein
MTYLTRLLLACVLVFWSGMAMKFGSRYLDQRDKAMEIDYAYKSAVFKLDAARVHCDGS